MIQYLNNNRIDPQHICYGCGVCMALCPHKAIKIILSDDGFWRPVIDDNACSLCGLCYRVCAYVDVLNNIRSISTTAIDAYAVINKDQNILQTSTSGGASYAIASYLHQQGYLLVGVKYDKKKHIACHFVTDSLEEFKQTMNSKYIPSYTADAFSTLMDGRKYVVFGTPCQIDSLRRWAKIRHKENNFVFVDLFCHGIPSYLLWNAYLKQKLADKNTFVAPIFRDKKNGWHKYTMSLYTDKTVISTTIQQNDKFLNLFLGNYVLNTPCYTCKYRRENSAADIRLGDLWGEKYANVDSGVTGVLTMTALGEFVLKNISNQCDVIPESVNIVCGGQLYHNIKIPSTRELILSGLKNKDSLNWLYYRYAWRMWIKNLISNNIRVYIKRIINKVI